MADTTTAIPSQNAEVVDRYRRWSPIWYPWIKKLLETIRTQAEAVFEIKEVVDELEGKWTVDISEQGKVRGAIKLDASETLSEFGVLADRFSVSLPDGTGTKVVFVIQDVGGIPTLGFAGNMFLPGSIQANAINATTVSSMFGSFGTMTAGRIQSASGKSFWNLDTDEWVLGAP